MRVVTAFCLACVCAELLVQLVEAGWARRCIKAVVGLYILIVLLRATAALPTKVVQLPRPVQTSASIAGTEITILEEASRQLNENLAAECRIQSGIDVRVETELTRTADRVQAARAVLWVPQDCPAEVRTQMIQFLRNKLGTDAVTAVEEAEP